MPESINRKRDDMMNGLSLYRTFPKTLRVSINRQRWALGVFLLLCSQIGESQISMAIELTPNEPVPGELVLARVTVTNTGPAAANNLRAELAYPDGLASMSDNLFSDGGDCTTLTNISACNAGEIAIWDIGTLPPGSGKTVYMSPSVASTTNAGTMIPFDGEVFEGEISRAVAGAEVVVAENRPLELEVDAEREPVAAGETLGFELTFGNRSGTATTGTELRFPLPAGTSLVEADGGGTLDGNEVVWNLGTLNPGDSGKRRLVVALDGTLANGEVIEVDAAAISAQSNGQTVATRQQATTRIEDTAQLAFSIDLPAQPLRTGVFSPIHVTVTNRSQTVQSGVRAELFFPPGLADMSDNLFSDGGDCTTLTNISACDAGETAVWEIGTLPPGAGKTVTLVPFAQDVNPDGQTLSFFGRAFADSTADFWDRRSLALEAARPLELEVDAEREPVAAGETLGFELTFGNRSGTATTGTELRFPLPAGTSLVEADGGGTLDGNEVVWNLGTLNPGDVGRRQVRVAPDAQSSPGDIVDGLSARLLTNETTVVSNDVNIRLRAADEFDFTLALFPDIAQPEQVTRADLVVFNEAPFDITNVNVQLYFPAGLRSLSDASIADNGDCSVLTSVSVCNPGETVFWQLGTMGPMSQFMRTIEPTLDTIPQGTLVNYSARIRSDSDTGTFLKRTLPVGTFATPPPPPEPEITVLGNGVEIVDGDATPSTADGTDFGVADIENETVTRSFVIENSNTGNLEISSILLSGNDRSDFRIVNSPAANLGAGEQGTLSVQFNPDNIGNRTAVVTIISNDADEGTYTFAIQGTGEDATGQLLFKDGFE